MEFMNKKINILKIKLRESVHELETLDCKWRL